MEGKIVKIFDHLEARWQDEKEYEPFADYIAAAKKQVEALGATFIALSEKPFTLKARVANETFFVFVKGNNIMCTKEVVA